MRRAWMIAVLSVSAAGCSTLSYQEPTNGSRARVRFATDSEDIMVLRGYADPACMANEQEWMRLRVGPFINSSPKRLGIPLWSHHENAAKEVMVEAGRSHTFLFSSTSQVGARLMSCGVPMTFAFSPDRDYEVTYRSSPQQCSVAVLEIVAEGVTVTRVAVKEFTNRITPTNAGCMEQFKRARMY